MSSADETLKLAENVCKAFKLFDRDGDGKISLSELEQVLYEIDANRWDHESCQKFFRQLDRNSDGTIDYTEMINYVCDEKKPMAQRALISSGCVVEDWHKQKERQQYASEGICQSVEAEDKEKELTEEEKQQEKMELLKVANVLCSIAKESIAMRTVVDKTARLEQKLCKWCEAGTAGKPNVSTMKQYLESLDEALKERNNFLQLDKSRTELLNNSHDNMSKLLPRKHLLGKISAQKWIDLERVLDLIRPLWPFSHIRSRMSSSYKDCRSYWMNEDEAKGRYYEEWGLSWHADPVFEDFVAYFPDDMRGYEFQALWSGMLDGLETVQAEMLKL
eukprot:TRINITY_DN99759_c0_g1_i1.p1 TRINITY_DN99759_c0_g1~~TRINITY_DN99759_c0_g1_i1.p1  ORF type:complete len:333 (-),score=48.80 TRINITY_DN99759_c0_g1_i1:42-1040(-)